MGLEEKRKVERFRFRISVQCEKVLDGGKFSIPFNVPARDLGMLGISFNTDVKIDVNSQVRVSLELEKEKISFIGQVVRAEVPEVGISKFLIGVKLEDIDQTCKLILKGYLDKINIRNVLDKVELANVIDIHFVAGYPPIMKRIDQLEISKGEPIGVNILKVMLYNLLDDDRYKEFIEQKESNFIFFYKDDIRFRVNLHNQQGKVEGVFRLIPTNIGMPQELGLPEIVQKLVTENKKGLILVAGRTGSGKSTTLASMIEVLNNKRIALVMCIEKPTEYIHSNKTCIIKQREVGKDTLSFSNAAKNALRQNPDVLVIGEILDNETMEVAITAAETGILVLSSIHAADSSQALDRVSSFFPAALQKHMLVRLSLVLKGVITQSLIPRKDGKALLVAAEVLVANNALKRAIRDGDWRQILTIIQTGKNIGMQSMRDSMQQYLTKGLIAEEYLQECAV